MLGPLTYARSSLDYRAGGGRQYTAVRVDLEESLIEEYRVPRKRRVSVSPDRVSVPMEEAGTAAERAPQSGGHAQGLAAVSHGLLCYAHAA
jgi:hypothetical protein